MKEQTVYKNYNFKKSTCERIEKWRHKLLCKSEREFVEEALNRMIDKLEAEQQSADFIRKELYK